MKAFVSGGAGFIGSNLVDRLLDVGHEVTVYDNLSTGLLQFLEYARDFDRFRLVEGDLLDEDSLSEAIAGHEFVFHLAANADVRFGTEHPRRDLEQNTIVTNNVLEAMRKNGISKIAFASTGSVYGDATVIPTPENAPFPIQTSLYAASKLAGGGWGTVYSTSTSRISPTRGIQNVVICVGYLGEQIEEFVKDGSEYGIYVQYSYETNVLLGTGGAIRNALHLLTDDFFVLYGDSWLDIDYRSVYESFQNSGKTALMTVYRNEGRWDTSNVEMDGNRIIFYSKTKRNPRMTHIDYGLGILKPNIFEQYPEGANFDLAEIYESLSDSERLASFEAKNRFYEIGSYYGLKELNEILQER